MKKAYWPLVVGIRGLMCSIYEDEYEDEDVSGLGDKYRHRGTLYLLDKGSVCGKLTLLLLIKNKVAFSLRAIL